MNRLILSAAASALVLGACATASAQERPPHLPADLSPGSIAAADEFIWLEEVQGERALAFVEQSNARALSRPEGLVARVAFEPRQGAGIGLLHESQRSFALNLLQPEKFIGGGHRFRRQVGGQVRRALLGDGRGAGAQHERRGGGGQDQSVHGRYAPFLVFAGRPDQSISRRVR